MMQDRGPNVRVIRSVRLIVKCPQCECVLLEVLRGNPTVRAWCGRCNLDVVASPEDRAVAMVKYTIRQEGAHDG